MAQTDSENRMKAYLKKIAAGPRLSKNLTEEEAEDALALILDNQVSSIRAGVFLIAARMKLETVPENVGYWRALQNRVSSVRIDLDKLLQIADPFDGFERVPYFGFYAISVIAQLGLPVYGHSALPLPPKFGITFEQILQDHYRITNLEQRKALLEKHRFSYLSTADTLPKLEALRSMRTEIVKRPMLATLEKILLPIQARENILATTYFHRGYEIAFTEIGKLSQFDKVIIGNGMEGTTLFGVHKEAKVFIQDGADEAEQRSLSLKSLYSEETARRIVAAHEELKPMKSSLEKIVEMGENALKTGQGAASLQIASQAGTLTHLAGIFPTAQEGFDQALAILKSGSAYDSLMNWIKDANHCH
jgi:anthranilate phosphoribosyltransferase